MRWTSIGLFVAVTAACGGTCPEPEEPSEPAARELGADADPGPEPAPGPRPEGPVVLDGTPEVPAALRERLRQFENTRSATVMDVADDGARLLIATRFGETAQLHEIARPLGAREQLTFLDEPIEAAAWMPGDAAALLYLVDVGGTENHQLFRVDLATGRASLLTDGQSRHATLLVARDGSRIAYNGNGRNGRDMDIYVADGRDAASARRVLEREGHFAPLDFSPDGRRLLVLEYVSINDARIHVVDLVSGEATQITPVAPAAGNLDALFGPGDVVYVTSDREGEHRQLFEVRLGGGEPEWRALTADVPWSVEEIAITSDRRSLAVTTNEDGLSVLRIVDTRTRRARAASGVPRGIVTGLAFASRSPVLAFSVLSATSTGDAYTYDLRRGRVERWTESEVGGLDRSRFVEPEIIRYPTFDEREIPAFYYRPRGEGPFPVVVHIHGGPESQARPWFSPLTQYLASEAGIAVLAPNVRGSDGYGKSYLLLDNGGEREGSVRDIGALLDWIGTRPELDASRVGVYGGSYGGYMVLASLATYADRIRAGVDMVGIANFVTFLENTADYRRDLRRAEYGDERVPEMRELLTRISPTTNASRIRSALFVAHGANDPRVPASEAEQIVRAVRANEQDVWYMLATNEGHGFDKKENKDLFLQLSVMFLERYLRE